MSRNIITLRDAASGATAQILPEVGFNCFNFKAVVDGAAVDAIWAADNFTSNPERPSGSGIPLLFPFPGRIRGTSLEWKGKTYPLQEGDQRGNAIHGFVYTRPWRVIERTESRAVGQFQASVDDPAILQSWPADFLVTAVYQLKGNSLSLDFTVENPDQQPLPFGFATHPYFRVPLGGDDPGACIIRVPVSDHWPLENMVPTGECNPSEQAKQLRAGIAFRDANFDDVFSGLLRSGDLFEATIVDPLAGRRIRMTFDDGNTACVVYTPAHREAICIEPYTCLPDPFVLSARGVDAGLQVLEPGDSFSTRVEIHVEANE